MESVFSKVLPIKEMDDSDKAESEIARGLSGFSELLIDQ